MIEIVKPITADEVINLIKASKKFGVSKIKFGTLEVEFRETEIDNDNSNSNSRASRPALKASKKANELSQQIKLQENFEDVKDRLSTLHVEDPVAFEAAIASQELEEQRGGDNLEETQYSGAESAL